MAASLLSGYDVFFTPPGARRLVRCRVCETECSVTRGRVGPTGFAMAMAGDSVRHDRFECPNASADWHRQARDLLREIEATASPTLQRLLRRDLQTLVARG